MRTLLIIATLLLVSCNNSRNQTAIKWINKSPKPIVVKADIMNSWTYSRRTTLIDSSGTVFFAGFITLALPDTIK